jgi:hypothetical protein
MREDIRMLLRERGFPRLLAAAPSPQVTEGANGLDIEVTFPAGQSTAPFPIIVEK